MSDTRQTYYRASLGLKGEIAGAVAEDYHSALIDALCASDFSIKLGDLTFHLAKDFGFCYGVDKAIDMAYEARRKFPDHRLFLLTELIHNPRVNRRMLDMGIIFLSGQYKHESLTFDDIGPEDVVVVPAFGTAHKELEQLRQRGCIIVDTTCGSVVHVWKRVEKYARDGLCSLVHGKHYHEETIATVSQATKEGGHFLVVRDKPEAQRVCDFIRGSLAAKDLMDGFHPHASSVGLEPETHLHRIGVANQTTMLATESLEIARMVGEALQDRHGDADSKDRFRSFDTICSATQDRQDAMLALVRDKHIDLMLVVGGFNSSNTGHLLAMAASACPAWHIEDASDLLSADEIRHLPLKGKEPRVDRGWLPTGPLNVGLTAGASTPNRALADTMARLLGLRGVDPAEALARL